MPDMKRRDFIALLGGGGLLLAAKVRRARAQQPAMPVIGFLNGQSPRTWAARLDAFRKGLNESGYDEGRNVAIEYRWAEGQPDRLPALAIDLVQRQVAVIVATGGSNPAIAAKAATSTIPIVFTSNDDPRKYGLVASLNRPGGNVTGVSWFSAELGPKRLALLRELLPNAMTVAVLRNPNNAEQAGQPAELQKAARTLGLQLLVLNVTTPHEIDTAFAIESCCHHPCKARFRLAGLAFTGRASNPLDRCKRFQIIHPPFLDLAWRKGSFILNLPSRHSITSSASSTNESGIVSPIALAALRLTINSWRAGSSNGRSPGRSPLRILTTSLAVCRYASGRLYP
jgi:ABC transporter substrate binding protein